MNNLRKIREQRKISQQELANILNVAQGTVSGWERGRTAIDSTLLLRISEFLNVTVDQLLGATIENVFPISTRKFPVIGEIAAGEPIIMNNEYEGLRDMIAELARKAGVQPEKLHAFRRKAVLDMHRAGEAELTIQKRIGHKDGKTVHRYIKLSREDMRQAAERTNRYKRGR